MKLKSIIAIGIIAVQATAFTAIKTAEYKVDTQKSKLTWLGKKIVGEHNGTINLADGKLVTNGTEITGGSFTIDMTSITNKDLTDAGYNEKLVGHLKSEDFFNTAKFSKSNFVITKIKNTAKDQYEVKGNLTIKGITNEVSFPATIQTGEKTVTAHAKIKVDRTKYGIRYGSGSFFDNLGEKAIDNEFELEVNLIASKIIL